MFIQLDINELKEYTNISKWELDIEEVKKDVYIFIKKIFTFEVKKFTYYIRRNLIDEITGIDINIRIL
jgi:hypothetical protein